MLHQGQTYHETMIDYLQQNRKVKMGRGWERGGGWDGDGHQWVTMLVMEHGPSHNTLHLLLKSSYALQWNRKCSSSSMKTFFLFISEQKQQKLSVFLSLYHLLYPFRTRVQFLNLADILLCHLFVSGHRYFSGLKNVFKWVEPSIFSFSSIFECQFCLKHVTMRSLNSAKKIPFHSPHLGRAIQIQTRF